MPNMAILTRNSCVRKPGVISDFKALFNANPEMFGRIKRSPLGHFVSAFGKQAEMFMYGEHKYICLKKGCAEIVSPVVSTCLCHSFKFTSVYGGMKGVAKLEYLYFSGDWHVDLSKFHVLEYRQFYIGFSGVYEDSAEYYSQLMDRYNETECPVIMVRTAEKNRFGLDLSEYFTDIGEFLILLLELY